MGIQAGVGGGASFTTLTDGGSGSGFGSGWFDNGDTSTGAFWNNPSDTNGWTGESPNPASNYNYLNGSDIESNNYDASMYNPASQYDYKNGSDISSEQTTANGSWTNQLWDMLHSKLGKVGQLALGVAFPQLGLPMLAGNLALGLTSGHGGEAVGGTLGGIGSSFLGPIGSLANLAGVGLGSLGSSFGRTVDNTINNGAGTGGAMDFSPSGYGGGGYGSNPSGGGGNFNLGSPGGSGMDYGQLAAGLGNLYAQNRAGAGITSQINNLNDLYSPNSPYAQQMSQALERQDAASGRRSQYGTRSVELQARLADLASRNAPTLSNLYAQQRAQQYAKYMGILGTAKGLGAFNPSTYGGLGGMFGGNSPAIGNESLQMPQLNSGQTYQDVMNTLPDLGNIFGG